MMIFQPIRSTFHKMSFLLASSTILLIGGCASGGFELTRKYARFVNQQNIIIRIVLYILTSFVFAITLLVDFVIFNTIDFWEGRVSANDYTYEEDGKSYFVQHSYEGEQQFRQTRIQITHLSGKKAPVLFEIKEVAKDMIELRENGVLKASVSDINQLPMLTTYDQEGRPSQSVLNLGAPDRIMASAR